MTILKTNKRNASNEKHKKRNSKKTNERSISIEKVKIIIIHDSENIKPFNLFKEIRFTFKTVGMSIRVDKKINNLENPFLHKNYDNLFN